MNNLYNVCKTCPTRIYKCFECDESSCAMCLNAVIFTQTEKDKLVPIGGKQQPIGVINVASICDMCFYKFEYLEKNFPKCESLRGRKMTRLSQK